MARALPYGRMKRFLQPKVIIPALLSVGLLAALLSFGDIKQTVGLMAGFQRIDLLWFFLLMIGYEIVRGFQWHFLLHAQGIHIQLRGQLLAFLFGEITKSMPVGNYFQNYILQQEASRDVFARTSAATTLVVVAEVAVSLVAIVVIGLGTWTSWLRPVIIIGVLIAALVAWLLYRAYKSTGPPEWMTRRKRLRQLLDGLRNFREGAKQLLVPRVLPITLVLAAIYVALAGVALYIAMLGIGQHQVSVITVIAVYCFSLAFSLIFPIPIDIGVAEIGGVGAFLAVGLAKGPAVGTMLIFRLLSILSALLIAGVSLLFLHREFRAAMSSGRQGQEQPAE